MDDFYDRRTAFGHHAQGRRKERVLASPRFVSGRFRNTARVAPGLKGNPLPVIGEYFFANEGRVPPGPLPMKSPLAQWTALPETGLRTTWLGHSTLLLEIDGFRVLTDPVFGERASPVSFAGPKRFHAPPATISQLPRLDAVLVSHDHYDHLCRKSIRELLAVEVPFVTSLGVGARLEAWGVPPERITELDWWETHVLPGGGLSFTAAPAQHFSGRAMGDRNTTLWSSWCMRTDRHKLFFSGDTGLTDEFRTIGQKLGPFDLVMLEIGAFHPSWGDIHLGPENALTAFGYLGGGTLLPVHWGTFNLALHAWDEPAETLFTHATARGARVLTPELGSPIEPARIDEPTPWWRSVAASR
jgi:L-ascorbate metabolism protein UlaG (beta-lactamase superfamily)